jgi:hypothetical protein
MCERSSQESVRAEHEPTEGQPRRTRREAIVAAGGGVGGLLAAQSLARPAPAQASHSGFVQLAHTNIPVEPPLALTTVIQSGGAATAFEGESTTSGPFSPIATGVRGSVVSGEPGSAGVRGIAENPGGFTYGVVGRSNSRNGTGVLGRADTPGGQAAGVRGLCLSEDGIGVAGRGLGRFGIGVQGIGRETGMLAACERPGGTGLIAACSRGVALRTRGTLEAGPSIASPSFRVDAADPAQDETAILVKRNVNGALSLQRVTVGPPGSGGGGTGPAGFRVLRVPN